MLANMHWLKAQIPTNPFAMNAWNSSPLLDEPGGTESLSSTPAGRSHHCASVPWCIGQNASRTIKVFYVII